MCCYSCDITSKTVIYHLISNKPANIPASLLGYSFGNRNSSNPPWLRHYYLAVCSSLITVIKDPLWHLCGFATASRAFYDDHLMALNAVNNLEHKVDSKFTLGCITELKDYSIEVVL